MSQIENWSKYDYNFSALGSGKLVYSHSVVLALELTNTFILASITGGLRRQFSHRYTQSKPSQTLELPLLNPSLTMSSDLESMLTTSQFSYQGPPFTKDSSGTESPSDIEPEIDIMTPKPKPTQSAKARSRIPFRIQAPAIRQRSRSRSQSTITQSSFTKACESKRDSGRIALSSRTSTTKTLSQSKSTLALSLASPSRSALPSYLGNSERIAGKSDIDQRDGKGNHGSTSYGHGDDHPCPHTSSPASSSQPSYASSSFFSSNSNSNPNSMNMITKTFLPVSTSTSPSEHILRSTLVRNEQRSPPSSQSHRRRHSSDVPSVTHSPPLKPHEQILRARLERALVNSDDQKFHTHKRTGSETGLLAWLWKGDEDQDNYDDDDVCVFLCLVLR